MQLIRFIHTSDVHLDTSFAASGFPARLRERKREAIRSTFRRILEDARARSAELVLIAGDLFEHERVSADTIEFLKQQLRKLDPIPVFIAPGNHDPCIHGSPYLRESWPGNVHIFREEAFRSVELPLLNLRVTGFGFARTRVPEPHFRHLQTLPGDMTNIVVAHGSDLGKVPEGKSVHGPLTVADIAGKGIQYCALGHYHQSRRLDNPIDETEVWYCGIPEGRGWSEPGRGSYLFGEIRDGGVRVERVECGEYPFQSVTIDCGGLASREQIVDRILAQREAAIDGRTILRVRLIGSPDSRIDLSKAAIEERLADQVLHIAWDDRTVSPFDFEELAREPTLRGRFLKAMNDRIAVASESEREVLERARLYGVQALSGREVRLR